MSYLIENIVDYDVTLDKITEIINDPRFGLNYIYDGNSAPIFECSECYLKSDPNELEKDCPDSHDQDCDILKLRSLVATLGDMIA